MSLHPIKAKHSSIRRARRHARLNRGASWGDFKPRLSLPKPNGKFNPFFSTRKGKALVLILLSLFIVFGADQLLKNPNANIQGLTGGNSYFDPFNNLWNETFASANLSGYNCNLASYITSPDKGIQLAANSTNPAICLTKSPVDMSPAAAKLLRFNFGFSVSGMSTSTEFGWFLTRNATLIGIIPSRNYAGSGSAYNPGDDPQVTLYDRMVLTGAGTGNGDLLRRLLIQRESGVALDTQAYGSTCSGGSTVGACWITGTVNTCGFGCLPLPPRTGVGAELNFTGKGCNACISTGYSDVFVEAAGTPTNIIKAPGIPPVQFQGVSYYLGFFVEKGASRTEQFVLPDNCAGLTGGCWNIDFGEYAVAAPVPPQPTLDTSGFFGPVIKALISIGVFVLNAALQFVAFIAPGLQTGLSFMVSFYKTLFDILGNLIWPNSNLGTAIFNELSNFVAWMVDSNNGLLAAFRNSTAIFGRFVDALKVTFPWLPTALAIALNLLTLAVNSVGEVITLVSLAMTLIVGGFAFYVIFFYFVYVGDDALGGVLGWMETMQWLIFNIGLAWTARISNYGIDIITAVIGIIPKPFIQMVAHQIPRIPIIETNARFVAPSFDFGEARAGNMFSFALWAIGLDFLAWYESRNPALPGSIGALIPTAVTPLLALNGMLPFLNLIVIISWGACIAWIGTRALTLAGLDLFPDIGISVGPGRKISSGPGGFKVSKGKKRFQGRTNKLVGERVEEEVKEKKITEAFQEAARKNQEQVEVKKARETGERIAKEELARRQKAEPGAE